MSATSPVGTLASWVWEAGWLAEKRDERDVLLCPSGEADGDEGPELCALVRRKRHKDEFECDERGEIAILGR